MWMNISAKNQALDAVLGVVTHLSVHNAVPSDAGSNEISGGSPAYARKAVGWDAASAGSASKNATDPVFDIPAGVTAFFYGLWTAITAGTFKGFVPIGGGTKKGVGSVEADDDTISSKGHTFVNDERVFLRSVVGEAVPANGNETDVFWVRDAATDSFKIAATQGGSAINFTSDGEIFFQRVIPESFGAQGTLTCDDLDVDLNG